MDNNIENTSEIKKKIIPTVIAVITLFTLVAGATFAYFRVSSTNNFGTKNITSSLQDMADSVILSQEQSTLSLDITLDMMNRSEAGSRYYASGSSTPVNLAKISTTGEGSFTCDYTMSITKSATNDMYTAFQGMNTKSTNQIYLELNGKKYDFNTTSLFPITYTNKIIGLVDGSPQYITANMAFLNKEVDQSALKNTDITLTFQITNFKCYLEEAAPIFAIYSSDDYSLRFYQNSDEVNIDEDYNGYTVTEVYTNLDNTNYQSVEDVPWYDKVDSLCYIVSEDNVLPQNTAYWFSGVSACSCNDDDISMDLSKLDTSNVTDMSYMFANTDISANMCEFMVRELPVFNTSKVTNMSNMFRGAIIDSVGKYSFTTWNTSNVEDMSYMFYETENSERIDLSSWDVSSVTNHDYFTNVSTITPPVSNWYVGDDFEEGE